MAAASERPSEDSSPIEPSIVIVWDPDLLTPEEYAEIVEAIGDVARAHGACGLKLVRPNSFGVPVGNGVTA
jgi:hypothetical protein